MCVQVLATASTNGLSAAGDSDPLAAASTFLRGAASVKAPGLDPLKVRATHSVHSARVPAKCCSQGSVLLSSSRTQQCSTDELAGAPVQGHRSLHFIAHYYEQCGKCLTLRAEVEPAGRSSCCSKVGH